MVKLQVGTNKMDADFGNWFGLVRSFFAPFTHKFGGVLFGCEVRGIGEMLITHEPSQTGGGFEVRREKGETFVWIGRIHVILTPAAKIQSMRGPRVAA